MQQPFWIIIIQPDLTVGKEVHYLFQSPLEYWQEIQSIAVEKSYNTFNQGTFKSQIVETAES